VSVIFTPRIRVKLETCRKHTLREKSHSACGNLTLRVETNLVRVEITLERVVITVESDKITTMRVNSHGAGGNCTLRVDEITLEF
jgi:hypothetical protein